MADASYTPNRRGFIARSIAGLALAAGALPVAAQAISIFDPKAYLAGLDEIGIVAIRAISGSGGLERSFFIMNVGGRGFTKEKLARLAELNAGMTADPDGIGKVADLLS